MTSLATRFLVLVFLAIASFPALGIPTADCALALQKLDDARHLQGFPNLFLPAKLRGLDFATAAPAEQEELRRAVDRSRAAVESALQTLFGRIVMPMYFPGETNPRAVRFFEEANRLAMEIDPTAHVEPTGGVVRSALGLLYEEMFRASQENPELDPLAVLNDIAQGKDRIFDARGNVQAFDIRGVGSDFDLAIESSPEKEQEIENKLGTLLKGNLKLSAEGDPNDFNKELFTIADINPYRDHIRLSLKEGGATLDMLAFDMTTGKLKEPVEIPNIVDDFLTGRYHYLPAQTADARTDPETTALRGPRALVEIPFLKLEAADAARLNQELGLMLTNLQKGIYPPEKALHQIIKLRRNGRLGMGNNRISRASDGTTLGLLQQIADILERKRQAQLIQYPTDLRISSYTPYYALSPARLERTKRLPLSFQKALLTTDDFVKHFTDHGLLYHGTSAEGALSSTRGGFMQTDYEIGLRRGTYTADKRDIAEGYASGRKAQVKFLDLGYLLQLPVNQRSPVVALNAIDLSPYSSDYRNLEHEAQAHHLELADWLAEEYGIDFILLDEDNVLLKNVAALDRVTIPSLVRDTIQSLRDGMSDPHADFARMFSDRERLEASMPLFKALDIPIEAPPSLAEISEQAVKALPSMTDASKIIQVFALLRPEYRAQIGPNGFGGKNYGQVFAEAMSESPDLVIDVTGHGYGNSMYGFDLACKSERWTQSLSLAMGRMVAKINDAATPPPLKFHWLEALQRIYWRVPSAVLQEANAVDLLKDISEAAFLAIRAGAAESPLKFPMLADMESDLSTRMGKTVDLTSEAMAARLRNTRTSRNIADQLSELQLLSWAVSFWQHASQYPEVWAEVEKMVPRIREGEDLLSDGTNLILKSYQREPALLDEEAQSLIARILKQVGAQISSREDLTPQRQARWALDAIIDLAVGFPSYLGPEVWRELKTLHQRINLQEVAPGYWKTLAPLLN